MLSVLRTSRCLTVMVSALACLVTTITPDLAFAKKGPLMPIQLDLGATVVQNGQTYEASFTITAGNRNWKSLMWVMNALQSTTFTRIKAGQQYGCSLTSEYKVTCNTPEIKAGQSFTVTVEYVVNGPCDSTITWGAGVWYRAPKGDSTIRATQQLRCNPATPTPTATPVVPTATPTSPVVATSTPTPVPTWTPTQIPTSTPTSPVVVATSTPTPLSTPPQTVCACNDNVDNDNDGKVDFPADPGCSSPTDPSEQDDALSIHVTKEVVATVNAGAVVRYTYKVTNTSSVALNQVSLDHFNISVDTGNSIDPIFLFDDASITGCATSPGQRVVTCPLGDFGAGANRVFYLDFRVPDGTALCGQDVRSQGEVYTGNLRASTHATTRVVCPNQGGCNYNGRYYFRSAQELIDAWDDPNDPVRSQAYRIVQTYGLTIADPRPGHGHGHNHGGSRYFWFHSQVLRQTLPAARCWVYFDPATGVFRIWDPGNYQGPKHDTFLARLGHYDACGVCCGDTSSCQPRR